MRRRALIVGVSCLAGAGLATAVWATQSGGSEDPAALARTLRRQMIRDGIRVAAAEASNQSSKAVTPDQMIMLAGKYDAELESLMAHAEELRVNAYHSRDIIRLAFIDDRMSQLRSIIRVAKPYFTSLAEHRADPLELRSIFSLIQQAVERARELIGEMEKCLGENVDNISATGLPAESSANNANDPTRPQDPNLLTDRPPEASTYR